MYHDCVENVEKYNIRHTCNGAVERLGQFSHGVAIAPYVDVRLVVERVQLTPWHKHQTIA